MCRVSLGCWSRGGLVGGFFVVVVVWSLRRVAVWVGGCGFSMILLSEFLGFIFNTI
jgi:hypothetical protein